MACGKQWVSISTQRPPRLSGSMRKHSTPMATTPISRWNINKLGGSTSPVLLEATYGFTSVIYRRRPERSSGKSINLSWRSRQDFSARIKKHDLAIFSPRQWDHAETYCPGYRAAAGKVGSPGSATGQFYRSA